MNPFGFVDEPSGKAVPVLSGSFSFGPLNRHQGGSQVSERQLRNTSQPTEGDPMKNMTKGALATAVGVALLLGGGGTLAVWNDQAQSNAGEIAAGNLDLEAGAGAWSSNVSGSIADISSYRVVPGETLTYSQPLTVTLVGDKLAATLKVTGADANHGFEPGTFTLGAPTITKGGITLPADQVLKPGDDLSDVVASVTFAFNASTTGRQSVNATYDFSGIGYYLEQQAPTAG